MRDIMSSFCFNFAVANDEEECGRLVSKERQKEPCPETPASSREGSILSPATGGHIPVNAWHQDFLASKLKVPPHVYSVPDTGMKISYIDSQHISTALTTPHTHTGMELDSLTNLCDSHHSDLIPGVYEGGFKTWECTFDLVHFLQMSGIELCGKSVLELGCGAGLPGIYALLCGAERVDFQDYNAQVLDCVTIPSVLSNAEPGTTNWNETVKNRCHFYSGDWKQLPSLVESPACGYDIILTSETIYSSSSQPKLLSALATLSHVTRGVIYLAAKSVYFGVGGSVDGFCELVREGGVLDVVEVWRAVDASIPRVILKLTRLS